MQKGHHGQGMQCNDDQQRRSPPSRRNARPQRRGPATVLPFTIHTRYPRRRRSPDRLNELRRERAKRMRRRQAAACLWCQEHRKLQLEQRPQERSGRSFGGRSRRTGRARTQGRYEATRARNLRFTQISPPGQVVRRLDGSGAAERYQWPGKLSVRAGNSFIAYFLRSPKLSRAFERRREFRRKIGRTTV